MIRGIFISLFFLALSLEQAGAEDVLSWRDCISEAQKNNPDLIYAVEGVSEKKAAKSITASGLYPQIDATLDASTTRTRSVNTSTGAVTQSSVDSYSYGVDATQLIFDGLKTINDVNAAAQDIKAAQQNYRYVSSDVRLNLRTAFVNLLEAQQLITVEEDIVKIRRDNLELITLRYKSGLEHKGALLTAEANIADAYFQLSQAKRDIELAQRQLTKEMGREELKPMYVNADFTVRDSAKEKPDLEGLAKIHPSVLKAVASKNSALFNIRSTYGNFAPELSGTGGVEKTSADWPPRSKSWNIGMSISMPIFEGGLRFAQVAQAKALYKQAEANERSLRYTTIVALEQAWRDLQDAIEKVDVKYKVLTATEERAKIAEAQYSIGFMAFDNWIIIQNDLVSAKREYLGAQADALLAEAAWIKAKGETLEYAQ